jgi:hypothetical protein
VDFHRRMRRVGTLGSISPLFQVRSASSHAAPNRKYDDGVIVNLVVEVIPGRPQKDPTKVDNRWMSIATSRFRSGAKHGERSREFF